MELLADIANDDLYRLYVMLIDQDVSDSTGMFDAFECFDEIPFNSVEQEARLSADLPPQLASFITMQSQVDTCLVWQSAKPPQSETEPIYSDIPTLALSGSYDPITPPAWGVIATQTLSNSTAIEFPAIGHGAVDSADCPSAIARAFINNPTAPIDTSCVATMRVQFITQMPDLSAYQD
jgi:pimeloyl-ACP methyl ester carboxylesterase